MYSLSYHITNPLLRLRSSGFKFKDKMINTLEPVHSGETWNERGKTFYPDIIVKYLNNTPNLFNCLYVIKVMIFGVS